ncbi:MAG TPA: arginine--tRNA ligase [Dehalococcoidia bacterium]|nr:arginine--tRNA ligase [Dehalococcoidia bacterium]
MIKETIAALVTEAATAAQEDGDVVPVALPEFTVDRPQRPEHGDYAVNLPMKLARTARANPLELAKSIASKMPHNSAVDRVEVAPPGFLNFHLSAAWLAGQVDAILRASDEFGRLEIGGGGKVQVEFVSANPTGPLHVGNGRGAVIGSVLADTLALAGYDTQKEYYVNDAGAQAELFGRTLLARYEQLFGRDVEIPEGGYPGDYMVEAAEAIKAAHGDAFLEREDALPEVTRLGIELMVERIRSDMEALGVTYDEWFHESRLYRPADDGRTEWDVAYSKVKDSGHIVEKEGAVWFASSQLGDDKDNVVIRRDGRPAYFASDIAYHYDKFLTRKFDRVINVWGADHQGHVRRMKAAVSALGIEPERLDILIYQLVTLKRRNQTVGGGSTHWERIRLSKRAGEIITVRDVIDEVGRDACRFFFLSRSSDAQMDFDVDLAQQQSADNPVYYVQYAHARIASVLEYARERIPDWSDGDVSLLGHQQELELIRKMLQFPEVVELVCRQLAPHHFPHYSQDLATAFHAFYTECRVVSDDIPLSKARLRLCEAAKLVLARSLSLMGVSAPEQM